MHSVIIGGTGHIGTYLVPLLVEAGQRVTVVSRGLQDPYTPHDAWGAVERVVIDREAAERAGDFGLRIAALRCDIVIDLISYTRASTAQLVEALAGQIRQFLHCGTIWTYGYSESVPTTEADEKKPWGDYGVWKKEIEDYLLQRAADDDFPASIFHPGHIVGPGWEFINPAGNRDPDVLRRLARGARVDLPHFGLATLHHVHASDLAQLCLQMIVHRDEAVGQSFNAVSPRALTLRGYAEAVAGWFGQTADLEFVEWEKWRQDKAGNDVRLTADHIAHSPAHSMDKAQARLEFAPRYTAQSAIHEALRWSIEHGELQDLDPPPHGP